MTTGNIQFTSMTAPAVWAGVLSVILLLAPTSDAFAQQHGDRQPIALSSLAPPMLLAQAKTDRFVSDTPQVEARQAARAAREAVQGRVISVKPVRQGKGGYRVRILADGGRVVTVNVDEKGKVRESVRK